MRLLVGVLLGLSFAPVGAAVASPKNTEGMLRVPAHTPLRLQLRETVSSAVNKPGETVWLDVMENEVIDGQVFVRKGTPVKATMHQGDEGMLDIAIPSVTGVDGNAIPVVAAAGQGKASYRLAGSEFAVSTLQEAWVKRPAPAELQPAPFVEVPTLEAFIRGTPPRLPADGRRSPDPIEVTLETGSAIRNVGVYRVGDWELPKAVEAILIGRNANGAAVAVFDGWDLARYLTPGKETLLAIHGWFADGTPFLAGARIKLIVEE